MSSEGKPSVRACPSARPSPLPIPRPDSPSCAACSLRGHSPLRGALSGRLQLRVRELGSTVDARCEWLTGFTGSAGIALVTHTHALLWIDGRYFVQAAEQLAGGPWTPMKMSEPSVPSLEEYVAPKSRAPSPVPWPSTPPSPSSSPAMYG